MFESLIKSNRWGHEVKCALVLIVLFEFVNPKSLTLLQHLFPLIQKPLLRLCFGTTGCPEPNHGSMRFIYSYVPLLLWPTEYCEINWHPSPYFGLTWTEMYYRKFYLTCYFVFSYLLTNFLKWNKFWYTSTHSGIGHFPDTRVFYLHFLDNSELSDSADITNATFCPNF